MTATIVAMYVVGAVLQTLALVRYLRRASADLAHAERKAVDRGTGAFAWDDHDEEYAGDIRDEPRRRRRDFRIDVALIGGGASLGAVASILALVGSG